MDMYMNFICRPFSYITLTRNTSDNITNNMDLKTILKPHIHEIVTIIENQLPGIRLILLCEDTLSFMKLLSNYRKKKGVGVVDETTITNDNNTANYDLYALYCGSCDELLIKPMKKTLTQYLAAKTGEKRGNEIEKKEVISVQKLNIRSIQLLEISEAIRKIERGDCRMFNLLNETRFDGKSYNILFNSNEWRKLKEIIDQTELRQSNIFIKSCVGQAYGLLRNINSCDLSKIPDKIYQPAIQFALNLIEQLKIAMKTVHNTDSVMDSIALSMSFEKKEEQISALLTVIENINLQVKEISKNKKNNNKKTKDEMDAFATKQIVIKKTINNCNVWKDQIRDLLCTKWLEENLDYKNDDDDSTNISDNNNGTATELNVMLEHLDLQNQLGKVEVSFMIRCGSFMYNLHTKSSDEDYFICFTNSTRSILGSKKCSTTFERHVHKPMGADKAGEIEYGGKEICTFVLELAKGNPRNIEFLFVNPNKVIHITKMWSKLRAIRQEFLNTRCINQYVGFIHERLYQVRKLLKPYRESSENEKEGGSLKNCRIPPNIEDGIAKYFYHAYHKIFELQRIVNYEDPIVTYVTDSPQHKSIMDIRRTRPLVGEFNPEKLLKTANEMTDYIISSIETINTSRKQKGLSIRKDEVDINKLMNLIKSIRILNITETKERNQEDAPTTENYFGGSTEITENHGNIVMDKLRQIEKELEIKIIIASELSSRSLGTSHKNSDHDVYCIFVHKTERYYSMKSSISKNFRMTFERDGEIPEIDIVGIECSHAFLMMSSNNLTMFELFYSKINYISIKFEEFDWIRDVKNEMETRYDKQSLVWSCINHAKSNYEQYIRRKDEILPKKYLHIIRRILMAKYILHFNKNNNNNNNNLGEEAHMIWPLPYSINMQLDIIKEDMVEILPIKIRSKLIDMLALSERYKLSVPNNNKIQIFDDFIIESLSTLKNEMKITNKNDNKKKDKQKKAVEIDSGLKSIALNIKRENSVNLTAWDAINCEMIKQVTTKFF